MSPKVGTHQTLALMRRQTEQPIRVLSLTDDPALILYVESAPKKPDGALTTANGAEHTEKTKSAEA